MQETKEFSEKITIDKINKLSALNSIKTINLIEGNLEEKRKEILAYFHQTYDLYENLFEVLGHDDSFYTKGCNLRHPLIFYYGHTATFFLNKLILGKFITERVNPKFESLFSIGVDEMSWDDLDESNYDWPSVQAVSEYRNKVKKLLDEYIKNVKFEIPIDWESPMWPIVMGIEHERIHLETSSVLIRQLPIRFVRTHENWKICKEDNFPEENMMIPVKGSNIKMGINRPSKYYGWDSEYGISEQIVSDFKASKMLVSNYEFLKFVKDGGYQNDSYWTEEGLKWKTYSKVTHPEFWVKIQSNSQAEDKINEYKFRTMLEIIDMPWSWPVEVNYLEAKAFCNWKSSKENLCIRLPREAEYHALRSTYDSHYPNWNLKHNEKVIQSNIDLEHYASSVPVNKFKHGDFYDLFGNVWQWTETEIYGFQNFKIHPLYDDFSTPTFDGRHNIIKGGSWISTGNEAKTDSRYAFRRHFFQHAGFRYIESTEKLNEKKNVYEDDEMVQAYKAFHYGDTYFGVENYSIQIGRIANDAYKQYGNGNFKKAIDIGCGVGRTTFELAKIFNEVIGLDFSANFIKGTVALQENGKIRYRVKEEGDIYSHHEKTLEDVGISSEEAKRCLFIQGDACNLKPNLTGFDLIIGCNLIDRLYNPHLFLKEVANRLNKGGILILADPYTWLEEYTNKKFWIGGYYKDGKEVTTIEGLRKVLKDNFEEFKEPIDVPFVIKETSRKFQHSLSEVSFWRKK